MLGPLFLAIQPDEETRSLLAQMLAPYGTAGRLPGKLSPTENWHITIRYFGLLEDVTADRLMASLDEADFPSPFTISLSGFGAFPHADKATVLWIDVASEALPEVYETVTDAAAGVGIEPDDRPFIPHLTLARIRPQLDINGLVDESWGRITFRAEELTMFESCEGRYEEVEVFPLGPTGNA